MIPDSLHSLIPIIKDTVFVTEKGFWHFDSSFYIAILALIISLIVAVFNNYYSNKRMKAQQLIVLRKEWIQDFKNLVIETDEILSDAVKPENVEVKINNHKYVGLVADKAVKFNFVITIDGLQHFVLIKSLLDFINLQMDLAEIISKEPQYLHEIETQDVRLRPLTDKRMKFIVEAQTIIKEEWNNITDYDNQNKKKTLKVKRQKNQNDLNELLRAYKNYG